MYFLIDTILDHSKAYGYYMSIFLGVIGLVCVFTNIQLLGKILLTIFVLHNIGAVGITADRTDYGHINPIKHLSSGDSLWCSAIQVNLPNKIGANQGSIFHWSRDHWLHHKFSDTDLDPHTIKRGFFFAHVGWLLLKKSP